MVDSAYTSYSHKIYQFLNLITTLKIDIEVLLRLNLIRISDKMFYF